MLADELVCDFRAAQTEVRLQGQRSTCAVFAVTAAHEWMAGNRPKLSEEDALYSAKQLEPSPGDAVWVSTGLQGVRGEGQALSEDWPYGNPHHSQGRPVAARDASRRRRCGSTGGSEASTVKDVAEILVAGHAAIITVRFVPETWAAARADGWVDDPDPPPSGAHAVLAVGCIAATSNRPDAVVFKNSWSTGWGRGGYGFFTDSYLEVHHQYTDTLEATP
jgi:Papain family cysteine protease